MGERMLSSEKLRGLLNEQYTRIDLKTMCAQTTPSVSHPKLAVWVHESPVWVRLSAQSVRDLWQANVKTRSRSFCHFISRDLLQLTSRQYANIKRSMESAESEELMGLYQAQKGADEYAIVLDFPPSSAVYRNLLLGGAALAGVLTVGGAVTKVVADRRKSKTSEPILQNPQSEKQVLADLDAQIEAKRRELQDVEQRLEPKKALLTSLSSNESAAGARVLELESQKTQLEQDTTLLNSKKEALEADLSTKETQVKSLNSDIEALQTKADGLRQDIDSQFKEPSRQHQDDIDLLEAQKSATTQEIEKLRLEKLRLDDEKLRLDELTADLPGKRASLQILEDRLKAVKREIEVSKKTNEGLNDLVKEAKASSSKSSGKQLISSVQDEELRQENDALRAEINKLKAISEKNRQLLTKNGYSSVQVLINELNEKKDNEIELFDLLQARDQLEAKETIDDYKEKIKNHPIQLAAGRDAQLRTQKSLHKFREFLQVDNVEEIDDSRRGLWAYVQSLDDPSDMLKILDAFRQSLGEDTVSYVLDPDNQETIKRFIETAQSFPDNTDGVFALLSSVTPSQAETIKRIFELYGEAGIEAIEKQVGIVSNALDLKKYD
jgi:hypothetical protein